MPVVPYDLTNNRPDGDLIRIDEATARRLLKTEDITAKYKIEVHFGKDRSANKPSTCAILIWESGRHFHGGGDDKMHWCGYPDCRKPIRSSAFGAVHLVCPHCHRECFLDQATKLQVSKQDRNVARLPVIVGEKLMRSTMLNIATALTKIWHDLDNDADIYVKYHPLDIRQSLDNGIVKMVDNMNLARSNRALTIYPLANILKDVSNGADLTNRFLTLLCA